MSANNEMEISSDDEDTADPAAIVAPLQRLPAAQTVRYAQGWTRPVAPTAEERAQAQYLLQLQQDRDNRALQQRQRDIAVQNIAWTYGADEAARMSHIYDRMRDDRDNPFGDRSDEEGESSD